MAKLEGLYAITPDWGDTARLIVVTEAILRGGCRIIQYRNKTATSSRRDEQAGALRDLTRRFGVWLIVNDDLDLALAIDADGAHLGSEDGDLAAARGRLGPGRILGASCYQSLDTAGLAVLAGADYLAFGSFFASSTKPQAGRVEAALIGAAKQAWTLPVCAIGGITPENAGAPIAAGADLLAASGAVYNSSDPERASRAFSQLFESRRP
ncbi:MAG: thiamine phosphate synthase [Hydrogenophilales bacterium CG03_land_8_20_14_0_80_62_28]|nr:thiamine phosphate synthase [Betaproteobacteria bacterium]PIV24021.1 MAG: thiamine phosphate synthase [Hydrogenophilales bacterium CG03_land_8_20_14_0_80_62_28]PIX01301.1 MAG: thiamine phosphate synthase [Hydrogenophilales bacterium CG_4_8_14_3_um_filter_62_83]